MPLVKKVLFFLWIFKLCVVVMAANLIFRFPLVVGLVGKMIMMVMR